MQAPRETLATRLGFLLLSAGCAIGLGNVWRFPYITGQYGGAVFVVVYLLCLVCLGLPLLIMEFAVGRAARANMGRALRDLEPAGTWWHKFGWFSLIGSYLLMMFYIPVAGWMLSYCWYTARGDLALSPEGVGAFFGGLLGNPVAMLAWTLPVVVVSFGVCVLGVRRGVERVVKLLMVGLLVILVGLALRAVTLPGGGAGIAFYLAPDWDRAVAAGLWGLLNAAMGQAFFTLGLGVGSMLIFGSYLSGLFRLRRAAGQRAGAGIRHLAQYFQFHARRPGVGHTLFRVHELRRSDHSNHRGREHCFLRHGRMGLDPAQVRVGPRRASGSADLALHPGFQQAGRVPTVGRRFHRAGFGGFSYQQQHAARRSHSVRPVLHHPLRLGMGQVYGRGRQGDGPALSALCARLPDVRGAHHHICYLCAGLCGEVPVKESGAFFWGERKHGWIDRIYASMPDGKPEKKHCAQTANG